MKGWLLCLAILACTLVTNADEPAQAEAKLAYRTDSANPQLPWYQLKPGEFPPHGSEHRVTGELIAADFIHRSGEFRTSTGGLVDFKLLPFGTVSYHNAEGDLRDVPLGTSLQFSLYQDESGAFTEAAAIADDSPVATDEARKLAGEEQRKKHTAFLKERGLPGWIERVEGKRLVVTLFGLPSDMQALFKAEGIDPAQWAKEHRQVRAVVANQDLRTYNPPVDGEGSTVVECDSVPTDCFGSSGVSWVIEPNLLLEGFRKGRVVRLFAHQSWPVHDMPFGEGVYTEVPNAKVEEESPNQYPFRTDFGNENLPWYQLKRGEFPPHQSQHIIGGELVKVDTEHRTGVIRADGSGQMIDFTMPPFGAALYHDAEAELGDLPIGTHYSFYMHQDQAGAFTRATLIKDDFSDAISERVTLRLDEGDLAKGQLLLARQLAPMKDERDHLVQPPDLGRAVFPVDDKTRVWKGDAEVKLPDLAAGDQLLVNLTGRTPTSRGRCTEIWAGADAHKKATTQQRMKHTALLKAQGMPAWIDSVEGKDYTVTFFAARRTDFREVLGDDPWGKSVQTILADDELHAQGTAPVKMSFKNHLPEANTAGSYGCSGVRWVLESREAELPFKQGQIIRVWKEDWPVKPAESKGG